MLTAIYFIEKFKPIPDSRWGCHSFYHAGMRCALGHCGRTLSKGQSDESTTLASLIAGRYGATLADRLKPHPHGVDYLANGPEGVVGAINDGLHKDFPQRTPKARILAALETIASSEAPFSDVPPTGEEE